MKRLNLLSFLLLLTNLSNAQTTVEIEPDKDNSIYAESTTFSNGLGQLYSGQTCSDNSRRALLHFDLSSSIPDDVTITGVTLTLNVNNVSGSATSNDFSLHRLTADWGEGTSSGGGTGAAAVAPDATWVDAMLGTATWTTPGGDYEATASSVATLGTTTGDVEWTGADLITDVEGWLADPLTNFGWILIGDELDDCSARRFGSKDEGVVPVLEITYICANNPTAVCSPIEVMLDESGEGVITAADLDGGSTAFCGGALSFSASQTLFTCDDISDGPTGSGLVLSGVYDGDLTGGTPKGIELYVIHDIDDLSLYGIGSANNGGGTDGEEFTFPTVSAEAGSYIYVATDSIQFNEWFGFYPNYTSGSMSVNGDDAIELFMEGSVVDVFGEIDIDGSGTAWEYTDGWSYRVSDTGPDGSIFTIANWMFSGVGAWDGAENNPSSTVPMSVGTFTTMPVIGAPVTLTVSEEGGGTEECLTAVTVIDAIAPTVSCITDTAIVLGTTGFLVLEPSSLDNGSTDACGIADYSLSQPTFDCSHEGENEVWLYIEDPSGNTDSCMVTITIDASEVITLVEDSVVNPTCDADDGSIAISVSGGTAPYTYDWSNDGTGDDDDTEDLTALTNGTYTVVVRDPFGCSVTREFMLDAPAELDLTITIDPGVSLTSNEEGATYQWLYCPDLDSVIDAAGQTFIPDPEEDGEVFAVVVTNADGCTGISDCVNYIEFDGIDELDRLNVNVYPNPSNGNVTIESKDFQEGATILVTDLNGKKVLQKVLNTEVSTIDLSHVENGVYLVKAVTNNGQITQKLTIVR